MKPIQFINLLRNKQLTAGFSQPEDEISQLSFSQPFSSQQPIELICQPGDAGGYREGGVGRAVGYYRSPREFYSGILPDNDSLFLAVIPMLWENIYANNMGMIQRVLTWYHRVADCLFEQERNQVFSAGDKEKDYCQRAKHQRDIDNTKSVISNQ